MIKYYFIFIYYTSNNLAVHFFMASVRAFFLFSNINYSQRAPPIFYQKFFDRRKRGK